jgi:hypothetical protein
MIIETKIYEFIPYLKKKWSKTIKDTYDINLFVKKRSKEYSQFSSLVVNQRTMSSLISIPGSYYNQKYNIKDLYYEVVRLKNDRIGHTDSSKFVLETISTQAVSQQSSLNSSELAMHIKQLNLPLPLTNNPNRNSSKSQEGQESMLNPISPVQNLQTEYEIRVSDEHQIVSSQEIRINQTEEVREASKEDSSNSKI